MNSSPTVSPHLNVELLDEKYALWKDDPKSVEATWAAFFDGFELGCAHLKASGGSGTGVAGGEGLELAKRARIVSLVYTFRTLGHNGAWVNPLNRNPPDEPRLSLGELGFSEEDLDKEVATQFFRGGERMNLGELIEELRAIYCDRIGYEFMHIQDAEARNWVRDRIENRTRAGAIPTEAKRKVLGWLIEAESFERFLHRRFVGQKRFSLEGAESLIVALNAIFEGCPGAEIREIVLGMAHRGRLNVLANFLRKSLKILLYEFSENYVPNLVAGDGDVKYHLGYETRRTTENGEDVAIFLAANPSHLEAVNGVVEGKARARQRIVGDMKERRTILPLLIHGDAAFAGQGSVAEVLNLSQLPGYRTGGTIHLVVNNQIGFTTSPADARSSNYCTDVAKMIEAPIFHVNGDHPLEVLAAAEMALEFRQKFSRDVVLDIVCYRRHGHNEGDEPAFTQPKIYQNIAGHEMVTTLFRRELVTKGELSAEEADAMEAGYWERLEREFDEIKALEAKGAGNAFMESTGTSQPEFSFEPVVTGIARERLREIGERLTHTPEGFRLNDKIAKRFLEPRRRATAEGGPYNWAFAESLAFGSLLMEGKSIRLSGQDCRRGTFSQRHAVLYDAETRQRFIPLRQLAEEQGHISIFNSLLSEFAVLAFDYGYSLMDPDTLVLWEAQFGDFANGAQVIIDQFISSAESKWQQPSSVTMLLPHGYEGQGPEHSSARLERFLQLCAGGNMQVCNLSTPAQYFHALRRQMKRPFRKPLILMTPKSLLTHPECVSTEGDFVEGGHFHEILDDRQLVEDPTRVTRLIFCSGKVYYDLLEYRNANRLRNVAIIRIEQIYPFHEEMLTEIVSRYPRSNKKWVWCQEEPLNMGAWTFLWPRLQRLTKMRVRYAGRATSSSPSAGSKAVHVREQRKLIERAFSV
ncbi:MAG: 2-oxoglutarate dehydrogenase E1 component [Verrucomicrobiota bacterium]